MRRESKNLDCYDDLKIFVDSLRQEGDLIEIEEKLNPRFEIGAILEVLGEMEGPAAFFSNVVGYPGKVIVGNIMGHRRRLAKAMGVKGSDLIQTYLERKKHRLQPVQTENAPVKQIKMKSNEVNLFQTLPALIHHEKDSSPYLTCAVTFAGDPETGRQSMGMHRIQVKSDKSLAICLETPPLARFLQKARDMNRPLEVAIVIGPDPVVLIASVTWCPEGEDKIDIAGALRQNPVEMIKCETVDLQVPAHSQYVIEGTIQPGHVAAEGIFGESSGIYVKGVESPVINVTGISHQKDPLYQALQTWSSEDDAFFNLCFGSDLLEKVQKDFHCIRDIHLIPGTVSGHVIVSVRPCPLPMIRSAMVALLTRNPFVKMVIIVDEDIDVRNHRQVDWAVATRFQADRDLVVIPGIQGSVIDPSASPNGSSCKIGIDATFSMQRISSFERIGVPEDSRTRAMEIVGRVLNHFKRQKPKE